MKPVKTTVSYFVDISRLIVYNSLVYVLMEFRGHT